MSAEPKAKIVGADLDYQELDRLLDRTKSSVFKMKDYAAFFGSLMSQLNFTWSVDIGTAGVDGVNFLWNPYWFLKLPPETRCTILMHELWHCAFIDMVRLNGRNHKVFNYATDIRINNMLEDLGYSFKGFERRWHDQSKAGKSAEEIYDDLMELADDDLTVVLPTSNPWAGTALDEILKEIAEKLSQEGEDPSEIVVTWGGDSDLWEPPSEQEKQDAVNNAVGAGHAARSTGAGAVPGSVEQLLKQFLSPIIPWEVMLQRFFTDLLESDFTWQVRDRRFQEVYLPGELEDDGLLDHLIYFLDVSGSISDAQIVRFNSEVKYIKETLKPKKLTLVQFDTIIQDVQVFKEEDPFEELLVKGRGGTCLREVRAYILEHKPTCAVVFSDLFCDPMEPLPAELPMLWVAIANRSAEVKFGQLIHIKA